MNNKKKFLLFIFLISVENLYVLAQTAGRNFQTMFMMNKISSEMSENEDEITLLESGYQYQDIVSPNGEQEIFPQTALLTKLPYQWELFFSLPTYIEQSTGLKGLDPAVGGIKNNFLFFKNWKFGLENIFIFPSGSYDFGSGGLGDGTNLAINYRLNQNFLFNFTLGFFSEVTPRSQGSERFSDVDSDLIFIWKATNKVQFYAESYGKNKPAPDEKIGINVDAGVMYLALKHLSLYLEVGQKVVGNMDNLNHYVGIGSQIIF